MLGTILVGAGEFLVHFSNGVFEANVSYSYFRYISETHLQIGHYLMIVSIPLYFVGYAHLFLALQKGSKKLALAIFILGLFAFTIGGIWVGSRGFLGSIVLTFKGQYDSDLYINIIENYDLYLENLVNILRILIFSISAVFSYTILKYKTLYPKWMAMINPFLLLVIIFLIFYFAPVIGKYLVPTAMNVAHLVLFSVSLIALKLNITKTKTL